MSSTVRLGLILLVAAACSYDAENASVGDSPVAGASSVAMSYSLDTLWHITSGDGDALLAEPVFLAAGSGGVWVTDRLKGLVAFDLDGRKKSIGSVPGRRPNGASIAAVAIANESTIVLTDRSTERVVVAGPDGVIGREIPLEGTWTPNALCLPSTSSALLSGGESALGLLDLQTGELAGVEYPWPALRDSSRLLQQVVMASAPGLDGCVLAAVFGGGFAVSDDGKTFRTYPTRETLPLPRVRQSVDSTGAAVTRTDRLLDLTPAAVQIAVSDTLIAIAFGGTTPLRLGLLDFYHRRTGAYLGSATIGARVQSLALLRDTLFVLHTFEDRVALTALRFVSLSAPPAQ